MTSYPYIIDLFKGVLVKSRAIEGRFYVSHRYGAQEINSDQLGEVLTDLLKGKKYPLALMAPPNSTGYLQHDNAWEEYHIIMFFVKTTYYDSFNMVSSPNLNTKTSMHTVPSDWHDMKRCAINFLRQLDKLQRTFPKPLFRVPKHFQFIYPVSIVGADRVSGVKLTFDMELFVGCELEDYDEYLTELELAVDSHLEHKL